MNTYRVISRFAKAGTDCEAVYRMREQAEAHANSMWAKKDSGVYCDVLEAVWIDEEEAQS